MQEWILHAAASTKKEAMQGGEPPEVVRVFGRAGDVWPVAQKASAVVTVAGVGCGRKKKKLQRREKSWKEKREKVTVAALPLMRS
jgi:hypothetical protein